MKRSEIAAQLEKGGAFILGEYRVTKGDVVNYRDKATGKAASFSQRIHVVESGETVVHVQDRVEDGVDPRKLPAPFSKGQTAIVPSSNVQISEDGAHMFKFGPGVSLDAIVRAINQVGAAPSDLISILQALKQAGALHAELVVI